MIRRLLPPLVLALLAAGAFLQSQAADRAADQPPTISAEPPPPRLSTPLLSGRRLPERLQAPEAQRRLVAALDHGVADLPPSSCLLVAEEGAALYDHQGTRPLIPASTQKLLTDAAALTVYGPDHVFTTRVVARTSPVGGVLDGDVWLIGSGDPLLMTSAYADRFDDALPYTDIEDLADAVAATGVHTINGAVKGDEGLFDAVRYVETWPERFRPGAQNQTGPLSALSVNDGFVFWDAENTANSLNTPAGDPAEFAAAFFDDLLEARSMRIRRGARAEAAPADAVIELASVDSPRMADIVMQMLRTSDNTTAELLLKAVGAAGETPGSTAGGVVGVQSFLAMDPVDGSGTVTADGSGLDPGNRVTCAVLVGLLDHGELSVDIRNGLATAGDSGTMRNRLTGSSGEGRVAAKTGSLLDVTSLAGVVQTLEGRTLTFAIVSNAEPLPDDLRDLHDRILLDLVAYPTGPPLALLEPLPVNVS